MQRTYKNIIIREVVAEDAVQLVAWWNDGKVMAHAGFPNGLGTTVEVVSKQIAEQSVKNCRHMILYTDEPTGGEANCSNVCDFMEGQNCREVQRPIGEMNYREIDKSTCEMGIKICDSSMQNKGLGKIILSLFIEGLFTECGYKKILLDTNLNNKRAQHVYEQLGFRKVRVNENAWKNQLGEWQSSVDYELTEGEFVNLNL